ncbi:Eukaryotic translation initiation factor 3 subunit B [Frankliniella fusca]|uniref:Eukaryotic translation initiation factor 3 subunit B n=1 Tax=Frankliniella fusca TaxID=407009 RepID=A0AAE1HH26_9NEOP|nr:Eukaryotic translation initiation factor 3 subunit B [Frankliniella fusca]
MLLYLDHSAGLGWALGSARLVSAFLTRRTAIEARYQPIPQWKLRSVPRKVRRCAWRAAPHVPEPRARQHLHAQPPAQSGQVAEMDRPDAAPAPERPPRRARRTASAPPTAMSMSNETAAGAGESGDDDPSLAEGRAVPQDGVLRGGPLSKALADESLGLALLRDLQRHGERTALLAEVPKQPIRRPTEQ